MFAAGLIAMEQRHLQRRVWIVWAATSFWLTVMADRAFLAGELWGDWKELLACTLVVYVLGFVPLVLPAYLLVGTLGPRLSGRSLMTDSQYSAELVIEICLALNAFATSVWLVRSFLLGASL